MFANDTNLFYAVRDIKKLFETVNNELKKIYQWFISNKLSINVTNIKYYFFTNQAKETIFPWLSQNYTYIITRFNDSSTVTKESKTKLANYLFKCILKRNKNKRKKSMY